MVNDKLSLYNQKPMGSGAADAAVANFAASYSLGSDTMNVVANRTTIARAERVSAATADSRTQTDRPSDRTAIAATVQAILTTWEPKIAANIYRALERSFG
jgi:hypothetical protein